MSHSTTEVAIIGGGPAGSYLANRLLQLGVPFALVERRSRQQARGVERAGLLEHRVTQLLARHGLAERLLAEGKPHRGILVRTPNGDVEVDMARLCEGRMRWAYPQAKLVDDMFDRALAGGADIRFEWEATGIESGAAHETVIGRTAAGTEQRLVARYVVLADGHAGIGRRLALERGARFKRFRFPHAWLAIVANAPPSAPHAIYALHPRGFAGHMLRTGSATRFYLQVAEGEPLEVWSDERIWAELERRLAAPGWSLRRGDITTKRSLALRSEVVDSLVQGRLLMLGDAAHIIPPCGGKGMNLALMDAEGLAIALSKGDSQAGDARRLQAWSAERLVDIWDKVDFSHFMAGLLHNGESDPENADFAMAKKHRWLTRVAVDPHAGAHFAHRYVG